LKVIERGKLIKSATNLEFLLKEAKELSGIIAKSVPTAKSKFKKP